MITKPNLTSDPFYTVLKSSNPRNFNTLPFSLPARYTLSLPNNSRQKPRETSPGGFEKSNKPTLAKNNACTSECAYIARVARGYVYTGCVFERIVCISMRPERSNKNLTSNGLFEHFIVASIVVKMEIFHVQAMKSMKAYIFIHF